MRITFKKVAAVLALAAIAAVSSVSFASAKQGSPDIGLWYYGGGNFFAGDVYSKYSPQAEGDTTWHSASVKNGKTGDTDSETKYDDGEWAYATIGWSKEIDHSYYNHD
ncbi:hypothetical protein [Ruminococcus sp.]|uniref:hypothetical protein n=1 Tax=Ruminococcus sp. TaxID=41978 RepID=UPI0025EFD702|nr:hypothetical protein [Ruminococcus sp.]